MKAFSTLLFFLSFAVSFCQIPIIFESGNTQSYLLTYSISGNESQRNINTMLEMVATYIPKPLPQTKVTFSTKEKVRITRNNREINVFVNYEDLFVSGDYFYKTFDVSGSFLPSHFQWSGVLSRKNGQELKRFSINESEFNPNNNEKSFTYNDTISNGEYVFTIENRSFLYKYQSLDRFRARTKMIDDYYLSEADMNQCFSLIEQVNGDDFEKIDDQQQRLNTVASRIQSIDKAAFWLELDIAHFDPMRLDAKMNDLTRFLNDKQNKINYTFSILHQLYYEKGIKEYNNKQRKNARASFQKATEINANFAAPLFYLSLMDYEDGMVDESMRGLERLFSINSNEQDVRKEAVGFAKYVENAKLNLIRNDIGLKRYDKALEGLNRVEQFCKSIPDFVCNDTAMIMRTDCHRFIYNDILVNAEKLFSQKKFNEAIGETDRALEYQSSHLSFIPSATAAQKLKESIYADFYLDLVKDGKSAFAEKKFDRAFELLYKAYYIEQHYTVKKDKNLNDLMKKSKGELLLVDAAKASELVKQNKLTDARELLKRILDEQIQFELLTMQSLNVKIEELKKSIFNQQCINAQNEFNDKIKEAESLANANQYIAAKSKYEAALKGLEQNRDCGIDGTKAEQGIRFCSPAAQYQQGMNEVNAMVRNRNYSQATEEYLRQGEYFNRNQINQYRLNHASLTDFIIAQGSDYIFFSVTYFTQRQAYETAFFMLSQLKTTGYPKKYSKELQVTLAKAMAIDDLKKNSTLNAKLRVADLCKNDKWYSYFSKAYQKQIKKLR